MSEEQNPTEKGGVSADGRRRMHQSKAPYLGIELNRIVNQIAWTARRPGLEAARQMERSWAPAVRTQQLAGIAKLSEAVASRIALTPLVAQVALGPVTQFCETTALHRRLAGQLVAPAVTPLVRARGLVTQSMLPSLALADFQASSAVFMASRFTAVVRPLQDSLQRLVDGVFRDWWRLAEAGVGLTRALAWAAVFAAMRARDAVLHGRLDEVDAFIEDWLDQEPTSWRRDAVVMVLLDGTWIPADPSVAGAAVIGDIKQRVSKEGRNHKWIADTQLQGYPVVMLDRPIPSRGDSVITLADVVPDPATKDGIVIDTGFGDDRLNRLLGKLKPEEQEVVHAYGGGAGDTWEAASVAVGMLSDREEVMTMAKNTGQGSRRGAMIGRSQTRTPGGTWVKRDTGTGQFLDRKADGAPFKGVRREK